jgi:hypothetical protein
MDRVLLVVLLVGCRDMSSLTGDSPVYQDPAMENDGADPEPDGNGGGEETGIGNLSACLSFSMTVLGPEGDDATTIPSDTAFAISGRVDNGCDEALLLETTSACLVESGTILGSASQQSFDWENSCAEEMGDWTVKAGESVSHSSDISGLPADSYDIAIVFADEDRTTVSGKLDVAP